MEKLLVTSNFSFSHIVFKRLELQTRKNQGLFGKGLRKETGRYGNNRVERSQRHCQICDMNVVEDEFHFLFICRRYTHLRKTYIKRTYYTRPNMQKCVYLLQSGSRKTLLDFSKIYQIRFRN